MPKFKTFQKKGRKALRKFRFKIFRLNLYYYSFHIFSYALQLLQKQDSKWQIALAWIEFECSGGVSGKDSNVPTSCLVYTCKAFIFLKAGRLHCMFNIVQLHKLHLIGWHVLKSAWGRDLEHKDSSSEAKEHVQNAKEVLPCVMWKSPMTSFLTAGFVSRQLFCSSSLSFCLFRSLLSLFQVRFEH